MGTTANRTLARLSILPSFLALFLAVWSFGGSAAARDLDCDDFGTREAANRELDRTLDEFGRDVNRLDADRDGVACERSGRAIVWTAVGAAAGTLIGFGISGAGARLGGEGWVNAVGHATAATFAGLFLGWLLPGTVPRGWTTANFALTAAAVMGVLEYLIAKRTLKYYT